MDSILQAVGLLEAEGAEAASRLAGAAPESVGGKHILVSGASGLIGTGLLAALRNLHQQAPTASVTAQVASEPPPWLAKWEEEGWLSIVRADLAEPDSWKALPPSDLVIHAAGYGQPGKFLKDPWTPLMISTGCTAALLKKLNPQGSFLFFSSTEVYQGLGSCLLNESQIGTTGPDHPRAGYIEGKRCGEALCHAARGQGQRAMSVRLAHTYGPGTRVQDRRVINMFIEKALSQGRIEMLDHGEALRTWGYLGDVVELCLHILFSGRQPVYNVGGHSKASIRELAEAIGGICGVPVVLPREAKSVEGAPVSVELDLGLVEKESGKKNYTDLHEGLEKTICYQKALYGK